jgi:MFS family permease
MPEAELTAFRRYGMVALSFTHMLVSRGLHGTFGIFYVALIETFGWSRAATAGAVSLLIVTEGIAHPIVGSLTDRLGPRKALMLGALVLCVGLGLSSTVSSLWELYLWVGVVTALGIAFIGMVPHVAMLSRAFSQRRGIALGIAYAGGGLGITLLVPLSQLMIDAWGWSMAYVGLAVIAAVFVLLPVQLFFAGVEAPKSHAAKGPKEELKQDRERDRHWTVRRALASPAFWLLFGARVLASMGNQIVITHQMAHAVDLGFPKLFAASIFGLMGVFSIFGRLLFGYLSDRMRGPTVFAWVQIVSCLGILALLVLRDASSPALLYAYAALYGLGQGSRALVLSAISAEIFLGRSFGAIYGYFTLSIGVGGAIGAWVGGLIHDITHSYFIAFSLSTLLFVLSVAIVWPSRTLTRDAARSG